MLSSNKDTIFNILSSGDTFNLENKDIVEIPKFGDVRINLVSLEGKKVIIKLTPTISGTTGIEDLVVNDLNVQNKALTCKAGKKIKIEAYTGIDIECSTIEEIEANKNCQLGGNLWIYFTVDTFGQISITTNSVISSFGTVKIGFIFSKRVLY